MKKTMSDQPKKFVNEFIETRIKSIRKLKNAGYILYGTTKQKKTRIFQVVKIGEWTYKRIPLEFDTYEDAVEALGL